MGDLLGVLRSGKQRTDAALAWMARCIGSLGVLSLLTCGVLLALPDEVFPWFLDRDYLPEYAWLSLLASSLLGWNCLQIGMSELREKLGDRFGGLVIVVLPLVCFALVELELRGVFSADDVPHGPLYRLFALWFPAFVMAAGLAAYVHERSDHYGRLRPHRALTALVLIVPYVLLVGFLALGIPLSGLSEGLQTSLHHLGATTVLMQIGLAYFFGTTSGV